MGSMFKPATRKQLKLRMALDGPAGSGKTYTGLRFAFALAGPGGKVAVIDTEHRSASKYQGENPDGTPFAFDVCELEHYAPSTYTSAIQECGRLGYDVLVIDSLSHAWEGVGGALDQVDKAKDKGGGNSFTAWKDVTPQHRELVEAILACPCHVIATMRSKMEYVLEQNEKGKMVPKKVGMKPIQREGTEYEFDIVCDMDVDHLLTVSKTRCSAVDGRRVSKPAADFVRPIQQWLETGTTPPPEFAKPAIDPAIAVANAKAAAARAEGERLKAGAGDDAMAGQTQNQKLDPALKNDIIMRCKAIGCSVDDIKAIVARVGCQKLDDVPAAKAVKVLNVLRQSKDRNDIPFLQASSGG